MHQTSTTIAETPLNPYLAAAGVLSIVVGMVHSVLGELLIFRRMRVDGFFPTNGGKVIGEGHVRIIWASWHVVTVFGWLVGAGLLWLSVQPGHTAHGTNVLPAIALAMLVSSGLVLLATRARHPGWLGLLAVAVLVWLGHTS